jgi:hypothetical protein
VSILVVTLSVVLLGLILYARLGRIFCAKYMNKPKEVRRFWLAVGKLPSLSALMLNGTATRSQAAAAPPSPSGRDASLSTVDFDVMDRQLPLTSLAPGAMDGVELAELGAAYRVPLFASLCRSG